MATETEFLIAPSQALQTAEGALDPTALALVGAATAIRTALDEADREINEELGAQDSIVVYHELEVFVERLWHAAADLATQLGEAKRRKEIRSNARDLLDLLQTINDVKRNVRGAASADRDWIRQSVQEMRGLYSKLQVTITALLDQVKPAPPGP